MANIGATTAFYKVETSLTRANNEVIRVWNAKRLVSKTRMLATARPS